MRGGKGAVVVNKNSSEAQVWGIGQGAQRHWRAVRRRSFAPAHMSGPGTLGVLDERRGVGARGRSPFIVLTLDEPVPDVDALMGPSPSRQALSATHRGLTTESASDRHRTGRRHRRRRTGSPRTQ